MSDIHTVDGRDVRPGERLRAHLSIMRLDHSVKQIFVFPGVVVALTLGDAPVNRALVIRILIGMIAVTLVASSNYVLNEMLDAPYDRLHPSKCERPAARGLVNYPLGYLQWVVLAALGVLLAYSVSIGLTLSALALWVAGSIYNIPPVRSKDVPYLDVLSESINNPLRFLAGWYMVSPGVVPPLSLLIAYWMLGAYFMGLKRFSEFRQTGASVAGAYRKSFLFYTEKSLLESVVFYAATSMLFFGAFVMRYRLELVLAFPLIALLMAVYFDLSFQPDSAVQNPEKLFGEGRLMAILAVCVAVLTVLLFVNLPWLGRMFTKSVPH